MPQEILLKGGSMPVIGIGTYQVRDESILSSSIGYALEVGYRLIDTAACYRNEHTIGNVLKTRLAQNDLTLDDVFLTSKLHPKDLGTNTRQGFLKSLESLNCDVIDLYLIHWPAKSGVKPDDPRNKEWRLNSWMELIKLRDEGLIRSIGVSNFSDIQIDELIEETKEVPSVNQCEFHPHFPQDNLMQYCCEKCIHFQAYSSFASPKFKQNLFEDLEIIDMSSELSCSVSQVLLAWALNQNVSVVPRSTSSKHILENWNATKVVMSANQINKLTKEQAKIIKYCWDPVHVV